RVLVYVWAAPTTSIASGPLPAATMAASARDVCDSRSTTLRAASRNDGRVKRTQYSPGGSDANSYAPDSPVTALRVPCSAGDDTVTATPVSGRPPAVTVPVNDAVVCACTAQAIANDSATAANLRGRMDGTGTTIRAISQERRCPRQEVRRSR